MKTLTTLFVGACLVATNATAAENQYAAQMSAYLKDSIAKWDESTVIVDAIKAQNLKTAGYSQQQIDQLDKDWRAEVGKADQPIIAPMMALPASAFLRQQVDASGGRIIETFVTDARGLNVAVSSPTSDYWQGDEEKFTGTFPKGAGGTVIGDVELDESTQTYEAQISTTLTDPATGTPIGTITVGLNVDALK